VSAAFGDHETIPAAAGFEVRKRIGSGSPATTRSWFAQWCEPG